MLATSVPVESDLGVRIGRSAGHVSGAIPSVGVPLGPRVVAVGVSPLSEAAYPGRGLPGATPSLPRQRGRTHESPHLWFSGTFLRGQPGSSARHIGTINSTSKLFRPRVVVNGSGRSGQRPPNLSLSPSPHRRLDRSHHLRCTPPPLERLVHRRPAALARPLTVTRHGPDPENPGNLLDYVRVPRLPADAGSARVRKRWRRETAFTLEPSCKPVELRQEHVRWRDEPVRDDARGRCPRPYWWSPVDAAMEDGADRRPRNAKVTGKVRDRPPALAESSDLLGAPG